MKPIPIVGYNEDRVPILNGESIFRMYDTIGLPLVIICDQLAEASFGFDVPGFTKAAIKNGWGQKKVVAVIREAFIERNGPAAWLAIETELDKLWAK